MKRLLLAGVVSVALCLSALPSNARTIVVGSPPDINTGNCYPLGCAYKGEYQQVYTHTLFQGPVIITALQFFNTQDNAHATSTNFGTFTISLSTTSADWNSLSPDFASNIGPDSKQVFKGSLFRPWAFGDTLTIYFSAPFTYDPADGNLLMDVVATGTSDSGGLIYFDTNGYNAGGENGNTIFGRDYCPGGVNCGDAGTVNAGYGLETGFLVKAKPSGNGSTTTPDSGSLLPARSVNRADGTPQP